MVWRIQLPLHCPDDHNDYGKFFKVQEMSSKELKEKPYKVVNRTGVPVAVPQFINSATDAFSPDLQNIITPKLWKLGTGHFERRFTSSLLSHLIRHVSHVTCDMSCVTWHMSLEYVFFLQRVASCWWRVRYQQSLPRLVFSDSALWAWSVQ